MGAIAAWQDRGRCRDLDQELFYPPLDPETSAQREIREAAAKAVCEPCPVRADCLSWALRNGERHGVWGGTTARERYQLARRRSAAAAHPPRVAVAR